MNSNFTSLITESWDRNLPDLGSLSPLEFTQVMNSADATVATTISTILPEIALAIDAIRARLQQGGRLFYVGAGTSGRLGVLDAAECPPTFNTPPEMVQAIIAGGREAVFHAKEGSEDDEAQGAQDVAHHGAMSQDVILGITASGTTPYVLGALQWGMTHGLLAVSLSCNPSPAVEATSHITIAVPTGPEILMGSTRLKAGSAQKMVLNMISTGVMVGLGKTYRNLMVDMRPTNRKLKARAVRIVMLACDIAHDEAADLLLDAHEEVKVAIAMKILGTSVEGARQHLASAGGILGRV